MDVLTNAPSCRYPHRFARAWHAAALATTAADVVAALIGCGALDAREWTALGAALPVGVHRALRHESARYTDAMWARGGQAHRPYVIPLSWARAAAGAAALAALCNTLVALAILAPGGLSAPRCAVSILAALALGAGGLVAHRCAIDRA